MTHLVSIGTQLSLGLRHGRFTDYFLVPDPLVPKQTCLKITQAFRHLALNMDLTTISDARRDRMHRLNEQSIIPKLVFLKQSVKTADDLLKTGRYSDFTIICQGVSFKVHKAQLHPQSAYFRSLFDAGFQESTTGTVTLDESEPIAVAMLLLLIYVGEEGLYLDQVYKVWPNLSSGRPMPSTYNQSYLEDYFYEELQTWIKVYALADRLLIEHIATDVALYITNYLGRHLLRAARDPAILSFPPTKISKILESIYLATSADDFQLRAETTKWCLANQRTLLSFGTGSDALRSE